MLHLNTVSLEPSYTAAVNLPSTPGKQTPVQEASGTKGTKRFKCPLNLLPLQLQLGRWCPSCTDGWHFCSTQASELLKKICTRNLVRKYCQGIAAEKQAQMQQKVVASAIFQGKKDGYLQSLNEPFVETRLKENDLNPKVLQLIRGEKIKYVTPVTKYDRNGFKPRGRQLVLTQTAAYVVELAKIKQKIEYATLKGISTSSLSDGILVIHVPQDKKQKGDVILQCENIFETVTKLCMLANKQEAVKVVQESLRVRIGPGKESTMVFTAGQELQIYKAKNGQSVWGSGRRTGPVPLQTLFGGWR
uniref:TH1 domain-containing protein n=1 Tax=Sphenodon punctatus TaxID=8508 RepID=A0A8D0GTR6_SPHPU